MVSGQSPDDALVGVPWPSTPAERKRQHGHRLFVGEVKVGDGALEGRAGLHAHVEGIAACFAEAGNGAALRREMVRVFNQKRALALIDNEKELLEFSDERPLLLRVLANHDPGKSRMRELLRTLPPSPHVDVRIATASLVCDGLQEPGVVTVAEALERFAARI